MSEGGLTVKEIADLINEASSKETVGEGIARLMKAREGGKPEPKTPPTALPISRIKFAGSALQPRDFGHDQIRTEVHSRTLTEAVKATPGHLLEPITVWWSGETWAVVDGHHRMTAYHRAFTELAAKAKRAGKKFKAPQIPVRVFSGSVAEAVREAGAQNSKDKLPMTKDEKLQRAWLLVAMDDPDVSKSGIASATGISERTVANMRSRLKELAAMSEEERDGELGGPLLDSRWVDVKKGREAGEPDDWGNWQELLAQRWTKELVKTFGTKAAELPDIFARAVEAYSEGLPDKLIRGEWAHIAQEFVDEMGGGDGDF